MPEVDKTDTAIQPLFVPLVKFDDEQRMVWGYASTPRKDIQGERVTLDCIKDALPDYMEWRNVREMHQKKPIGITKSAEVDDKGLYIGCKIIGDENWEKVKPDADGDALLKGFSVGGQWLEKDGTDITKMRMVEISLVDRPANPDCRIDVIKVAGKAEKHADPNDLNEVKKSIIDIPEDEARSLRAWIVEKVFGKAADPKEVLEEEKSAIAARVEKAPEATTVAKGMAPVIDLAHAYQQLLWVKRALLDEATWEKDPKDEAMSEKIGAILLMIGDLIQEKTAHEMDELKEGDEDADGPGAVLGMAQESTTVEKGVRSGAHKGAIMKAAGYVVKAAKMHAKMGEQMDAMSKCVGKAADGGNMAEMCAKMADAHEMLGEHLDMAAHHLGKAAMDVSGGEESKSKDEMEKAARIEAQKKADDAEVEAAAKETKVEKSDSEFDFSGMNPKQIEAFIKAREDKIKAEKDLEKAAAIAETQKVERKASPAGPQRVRLNRTTHAAEMIEGEAGGIDPDIAKFADATQTMDVSDPNFAKVAGNAIAAIHKKGGRSVVDPQFKGTGGQH